MKQDTKRIYQSDIWQEMLSGKPYEASHPLLIDELDRVKDVLYTYNNEIRPGEVAKLSEIAKSLLGSTGKVVKILPPFHVDYGHNFHVGENFFANFNFTVLDEGEVRIGDNAFIGPNVSIFTACHPTNPSERNLGTQWTRPVLIGNNVWIGGSATILPGVTIGNNVTIGAGSVVTRDIPDNSVVVGNPARVIKRIGE